MNARRGVIPILALVAAIAREPLAGQCRPPASSHEARLLAFFEAPAVFSLPGAPEVLEPGDTRIGAELVPVPSPNAEITHPNFCYQNTTNNTKLAPLLGRPRLVIGLPAGLVVEGSYFPPITVSSARATLASVALSRVEVLSLGGLRPLLQLRAHATTGRIQGPITCPRQNLQLADAGAPCYGTSPSLDAFDPNSVGVEGALGMRAHGVDGYVGAGTTWLRPHFQTGFTDAAENTDRTTIDVSLVRAAVFGGVTLHVRKGFDLSGQVYAVPADVTTLRIGLQYRLR